MNVRIVRSPTTVFFSGDAEQASIPVTSIAKKCCKTTIVRLPTFLWEI
jgi:hypothetical protein